MSDILEFSMGPTWEAVAHFVHGGVTVFFIVWSWLLWPLRKQSNMMFMLFLNMLYFAFCNVKDLIFLVDGYWKSLYWSRVSVTIDLLYVPIVFNFFIEVVSPGWVKKACEIIDEMSSENKLSMQEVAEISGFNSISTFNRAFFRKTGSTPGEYARRRG